MNQAIKALNGSTIGYMEESSNGEVKIKDSSNRTLGVYKPRENATFLTNGAKYANGNNLRSLLNC